MQGNGSGWTTDGSEALSAHAVQSRVDREKCILHGHGGVMEYLLDNSWTCSVTRFLAELSDIMYNYEMDHCTGDISMDTGCKTDTSLSFEPI